MLSFAKTAIIDDQILEITPQPDFEITRQQVQEIETLLDDTNIPKLLLINKKHDYSFSFDAILAARQLPHVQAMAIVAANTAARHAAEVIHGTETQSRYPYLVVPSRDEAIDWLVTIA